MPDNLVDLRNVSGSLTVREEPDDERAARLVREDLELRHRLHKELVQFYAFGGLYIAALVTTFLVVITTDDAKLRELVTPLVTTLAGALVGYIAGRQQK